MPFSTVYTEVTTRLQYVADSVDNPRALSDDTATADLIPPLYVWDPQDITPASGDIGLLLGNQNPKAYALDAHNWLVACWGATRDDCERMRSALITAVRLAMQGPSYRIGSAQWGYADWARSGYVLAVPLTVFMPQVSASIPDGAGTGIPSTDVINDVIETVTITAVNPLDSAGSVEGDDLLDGGEG